MLFNIQYSLNLYLIDYGRKTVIKSIKIVNSVIKSQILSIEVYHFIFLIMKKNYMTHSRVELLSNRISMYEQIL